MSRDTFFIIALAMAMLCSAIYFTVTVHEDRKACRISGGQPITDKFYSTACIRPAIQPDGGPKVPEGR